MFMGIGLKFAGWLAGTGLTTILGSVTDVYKAKLAAGADEQKLAADLAARELALQMQDADIQGKLAAADGAGPRRVLGYSVAFYVAKLLVWDKVLGLGVTDAVDPKLFWVMQTIIIAYFGHGALNVVASAFRTKS